MKNYRDFVVLELILFGKSVQSWFIIHNELNGWVYGGYNNHQRDIILVERSRLWHPKKVIIQDDVPFEQRGWKDLKREASMCLGPMALANGGRKDVTTSPYLYLYLDYRLQV